MGVRITIKVIGEIKVRMCGRVELGLVFGLS